MAGAEYERTLLIIKPEAMKHRDTIADRLRDAGFTIVQSRIVRLTPEQAAEFYRSRQQSEPNFRALVVALASGSIQAMCVSKERALEDLLWLIGPDRFRDAIRDAPGSLRALFGDPQDDLRNAVHGSRDAEAAHFEIRFFFPSLVLEPIFSEPALNGYLGAMVNPTLMEGLFLLAKERPPEPVLWLSNWLLRNNPYKPKADPFYDDIVACEAGAMAGATETELEDGAGDDYAVFQGGHVGAQAECECSEYRHRGICTCSLSTIAEME